jgi:hypothetical protein
VSEDLDAAFAMMEAAILGSGRAASTATASLAPQNSVSAIECDRTLSIRRAQDDANIAFEVESHL